VPQHFADLYIDTAVLANAPHVWVQADFQVADVLKSSRTIASAAQNLNGYVASQSINNVRNDIRSADKQSQNIALVSYQREASMTVRVPKAQTKAFLAQVQKQVLLLNAQSFDIEGHPQHPQLTDDSETANSSAASNNDAAASSNVANNTSSNGAPENEATESIDIEAADSTYSVIELTFRQMTGVYRESSRNTNALVDAEIPQGKY